MAARTKAIVSPLILEWARRTARLSLSEAAKKLNVTEERLILDFPDKGTKHAGANARSSPIAGGGLTLPIKMQLRYHLGCLGKGTNWEIAV